MIAAALLLGASQSVALPPPVSVGADAFRAVPAMALHCDLSRRSGQASFALTARLPAVPLKAQRNGQAYGLQAGMVSEAMKVLTGNFPANLTFSISDIAHYSVLAEEEGGGAYIVNFQTYGRSGQGFVSVTGNLKDGSLTAYAAGLCTSKASDR